MAQTPFNTNDKICRLCGQISSKTMGIFTGTIHNLHEIINAYLPINVFSTDILPLVACETCINILLTFEQLVLTCIETNKGFEDMNPNYNPVPDSKDNINLAVCFKNEILLETFEASLDAFEETDQTDEQEKEPDITTQEFNQTDKELPRTKKKGLKSDDGLLNFLKETINDQVVYKCKICSKVLKSLNSILNHLRTHTGERPYICDHCGQTFRIRQSLTLHINERHKGIRNYACDICNKWFTTKRIRNEHRFVHTNEKKYICDICGKSFKQRSSLHNHSKTHDASVSFKCDQCDRKFKSKIILRRHSTIHNGEKPHKCDICPRAFRFTNELTRHKDVHKQTKPFSCDICGYAAKQKRYLDKHKKTNHIVNK